MWNSIVINLAIYNKLELHIPRNHPTMEDDPELDSLLSITIMLGSSDSVLSNIIRNFPILPIYHI